MEKQIIKFTTLYLKMAKEKQKEEIIDRTYRKYLKMINIT